MSARVVRGIPVHLFLFIPHFVSSIPPTPHPPPPYFLLGNSQDLPLWITFLLSYYFFFEDTKIIIGKAKSKKKKKRKKEKICFEAGNTKYQCPILYSGLGQWANKQNNCLESFFKHFLRISNFCTRNVKEFGFTNSLYTLKFFKIFWTCAIYISPSTTIWEEMLQIWEEFLCEMEEL